MAVAVIALIGADDRANDELASLMALRDFEVVSIPEHALEHRMILSPRVFIVGNSREDPTHAMALVRRLHGAHRGTPVVLLAWTSSENLAIAALKEGEADYFPPPIKLAE